MYFHQTNYFPTFIYGKITARFKESVFIIKISTVLRSIDSKRFMDHIIIALAKTVSTATQTHFVTVWPCIKATTLWAMRIYALNMRIWLLQADIFSTFTKPQRSFCIYFSVFFHQIKWFYEISLKSSIF